MCLPFEGLDFVVEALDLSSGDSMMEIHQESKEVLFEVISELDEMLDSEGPCLIDPGIEEGLRHLSFREIPACGDLPSTGLLS
jgi:hypothetical protein